MPGNYSPPPTLVDGQLYTAADHNTAWQTLYNNADAVGTAGESATVAAMQTQVDPGGVGTESLAISVAGELRRKRYVLALMKGTTYWYEESVLRHVQLASHCLDGSNNIVRPLLVDAATRVIRATFRLTNARVADTEMLWRVNLKPSVGTNTAVLTYDVTRHRLGAASTSLHSGNANFTSTGTTMVLHDIFTIPDAGGVWVQGDVIDLTLTRLGADGSDTLAGTLDVLSVLLRMTTYAGRPL